MLHHTVVQRHINSDFHREISLTLPTVAKLICIKNTKHSTTLIPLFCTGKEEGKVRARKEYKEDVKLLT